MERVPHSWREAYEMALRESDPSKLVGRIEYAIIALERRYSEWGTDAGTAAELTAIQDCIPVLERLMKRKELWGIVECSRQHSWDAQTRGTTASQ